MTDASKHQRKNSFLKIFENLLILSLILSIYCSGLSNISFHGDESSSIYTSSVYEAFISGDFSSAAWDESYWNLTQPNFFRYIIGFGRNIGGFGPHDLNYYWDWNHNNKRVNEDEGRMPSDQLLWWSRLPFAIITIISIFGGFIFLSQTQGRLSSYIWVGLSLFSNYFLIILRRTRGESPLIASIVLILLLSVNLLRNATKIETKKYVIFLLINIFIIGILIGLAESSKLNGLSVLAAGFAFSIIITRIYRNKIQKIGFCFLSILILILASQLTWFLLNPYLWSDPINRTIKMYTNRIDEMGMQKIGSPSQSIEGIDNRIKIIFKRIFQDYATIAFNGSWIINTFFFSIGLIIIIAESIHYFRKKILNPGPISLLLISFSTSFPALLTPLDWDRYYLLPVFFSTMFISIGIEWLTLSGYDFVNRQINRIGICIK